MVCVNTMRSLTRTLSKKMSLTGAALLLALCAVLTAGDRAQAQAAKIVDGKMQIDLTSDRAKASLAPTVDASKFKVKGQVYLPLYSSVVVGGGATLVHMGANVTLRNVSADSVVTLTSVRYFDRNGELVSQLAPQPISLKPMATIEIFIPITEASVGIKGGRGGSILTDWGAEQSVPEPLTEALVLGSVGNGSYSFTVQGHGLTPLH